MGGTPDLALVDLADHHLSTLDTAGDDRIGGFALDAAGHGWLRAQLGPAGGSATSGTW